MVLSHIGYIVLKVTRSTLENVRVQRFVLLVGNHLPDINTKQLEISTTTNKVDPTYTVKVRYTKSASKWTETEIKSSFAKWFSEDGYFVARPFQHFLASSIPIVGEADPKNIAPYVEPVAAPSAASTATDLKNVDITYNNVDDILAAINQGPQTRKRG
jgi:hypothetical protein